MPRCETCGKTMKNALAMKIHTGRMHKKGQAPKARRAATPVAAPPVELDVRSLAIDALIAIKQQIDGRLADVARRLQLAGVIGGQPIKKTKIPTLAATVRRGLDRAKTAGKPLAEYVREVLAKAEKGLSIKEIEAKVLAAGYPTKAKTIYSQVAKVVGQGFKKMERGVYALGTAAKAGAKAAKAAMAEPAAKKPAPAAKKARKRGTFKVTGDQMILDLLAGGKSLTTAELGKAWKAAGRGGKADNPLTKLVKAKKIKRAPNKGGQGSNYTLA